MSASTIVSLTGFRVAVSSGYPTHRRLLSTVLYLVRFPCPQFNGRLLVSLTFSRVPCDIPYPQRFSRMTAATPMHSASPPVSRSRGQTGIATKPMKMLIQHVRQCNRHGCKVCSLARDHLQRRHPPAHTVISKQCMIHEEASHMIATGDGATANTPEDPTFQMQHAD